MELQWKLTSWMILDGQVRRSFEAPLGIRGGFAGMSSLDGVPTSWWHQEDSQVHETVHHDSLEELLAQTGYDSAAHPSAPIGYRDYE